MVILFTWLICRLVLGKKCAHFWSLNLCEVNVCSQSIFTLGHQGLKQAVDLEQATSSFFRTVFFSFFSCSQTTVFTTTIYATLNSRSWCSKATGKLCPTPSLSTERKSFLRKMVFALETLQHHWLHAYNVYPQFNLNNSPCVKTLYDRSTDSQLKLWNVNKPHCLRSFKGHINEKNFVGLASNGDYVACGKHSLVYQPCWKWIWISSMSVLHCLCLCVCRQWEQFPVSILQRTFQDTFNIQVRHREERPG